MIGAAGVTGQRSQLPKKQKTPVSWGFLLSGAPVLRLFCTLPHWGTTLSLWHMEFTTNNFERGF